MITVLKSLIPAFHLYFLLQQIILSELNKVPLFLSRYLSKLSHSNLLDSKHLLLLCNLGNTHSQTEFIPAKADVKILISLSKFYQRRGKEGGKKREREKKLV